MATTRTVTGTVLKPDGTVYTDWALVFKLIDDIISDGDVIPGHSIEITTDGSGDFSTTLAVPTTGTAYYSVQFRNLVIYEFNLAARFINRTERDYLNRNRSSDPNYITELTSLDITQHGRRP